MERLIILLLTILLMSTICYADSDYWTGGRGAWDVAYVCMSGVGFLYIDKYVTDNTALAIILTFSAAFLKEFLDELYQHNIIRQSSALDNIFDKYKGFSKGDIMRTGLGISIVIPLRK